MEVIYENDQLRRIKIDTAKTEQFLLDQGMSEKKIKKIRIYVQEMASEAQKKDLIAQNDTVNPWGLYYKPGHVYLFTHGRPSPMAPSLNKTLIHELRHHQKNGYRPGEIQLSHAQRPSEIDAYAFAAEQAKEHTLLTIPGESPLSPDEDAAIQVLAIGMLICGALGAAVVLRWLNKMALSNLLGTMSRKRGK